MGVHKVMRVSHQQGGAVGRGSSGVVCENRLVGSEFTKGTGTNTHTSRISAGEAFRGTASKGILKLPLLLLLAAP